MSILSSAKTTQDFIPIKEIRDGIVILKDGSMRAIIMVSSTNFSLKSQEEQEGILFQFQNFLNSLDSSIQIFLQSRRLDIKPYLNLLEQRKKEEVNSDLLKVQITEYIEFVRNFIDNSNIMTKNFFVVVPYSPSFISSGKKKGIIPKKQKKADKNKDKEESFQGNLSQLQQRLGVVEQGLVRCGLRVSHLETEEVVELFYRIFNPGETGGVVVKDES